MRIFNETKTEELQIYDLENGYLKPDKLFIAHHDAVEDVTEQGHYEVVAECPATGGKEVVWVVDIAGVKPRDALDEYEDIQVYVPYTHAELAAREIAQLKAKLSATDYQAIKYAEGILTAEEYADMKAQRQAWRDRINELEGTLNVQL